MRRLLLIVCIAAILAAALSPLSSGLLWVILVPVWFFVASTVAVALVRELEPRAAQPLKFLSVVGSRAPPL